MAVHQEKLEEHEMGIILLTVLLSQIQLDDSK